MVSRPGILSDEVVLKSDRAASDWPLPLKFEFGNKPAEVSKGETKFSVLI
jgi:hypothetical protein